VMAPRNWTGITHKRRIQSKAPAIQSPMATYVLVSQSDGPYTIVARARRIDLPLG
jgi:hypothetical protein